MANRTGSIIFGTIGVAVGAGMYFIMRDALIKSGGESLVPLLAVGVVSAWPIAWATYRWEGKLMSIKAIGTTVAFFKKTQWIWFGAIAIGTIVLNVI